MPISSQGGRVKYRDYFGYKVSPSGEIIGKRGKPMRPSDNGKGYLIVTILRDGKAKTKAVHRLVAECWIDNPDNLSDVDHIDGNKLNNNVQNLRWVTHVENIKHSYSLSNRSATGVNNARCKTSEKTVREVCQLLAEGYPPYKIRDMGYSYNLVRGIRRGSNWSHISKEYFLPQGSETSRKA